MEKAYTTKASKPSVSHTMHEVRTVSTSLSDADPHKVEAMLVRQGSRMMNAQEQEEWEQKVKRSQKKVAEALKARHKDLVTAHPLRSFKTNLVVMLYHHTGKVMQRKCVVMPDNLAFKEFEPWLRCVLFGAEPPAERVHGVKGTFGGSGPAKDPKAAGPKKQLASLVYVNELGAQVEIVDSTTHGEWLDTCWYKHPPELFVYDVDALLQKAQRKWDATQELFRMLDVSGDGKIDRKEMLMARQMSELLECNQDDVAQFWEAAFLASDANKDGDISYEEFVTYFNDINDKMREGILREGQAVYTAAKTRFALFGARSWRRTLKQASTLQQVSVVAKRSALDAQRSHLSQCAGQADEGLAASGFLSCDANPSRDHAVELHLPAACVTEENQHKYVQLETWTEDMIDQFSDRTGGRMRDLMSPIVHIEFESGVGVLPQPCELYLPHAFAEKFAMPPFDSRTQGKEGGAWHGFGEEESPITKADLVVVHAHPAASCWEAVDDLDYDLVSAADGLGGMPAVRVRAALGGIYAVYSCGITVTRCQILAFCNSSIVPVDPATVRVYVVPDTPDQLDAVLCQELAENGLVTLAGWSTKALSGVAGKTKLKATMWDTDDPKDVPRVKEAQWEGDTSRDGDGGLATSQFTRLEYTIHPSDWFDEQLPVGGHMVEEYHLKMEFSTTFRPPNGFVATDETQFTIKLVAHNFPPPGKPRNLKATARNQLSVHCTFKPPRFWGGCTLRSYELQIAHVDHDGHFLKGDSGQWHHADTIPATSYRHEHGQAMENVNACKLRVRAYNSGSLTPSEWSDELWLHPEKEEAQLAYKAAGKAIDAETKARHQVQRQTSTPHVRDEQGMALIAQSDLSARAWKQWVQGNKKHAEQEKRSMPPFVRRIADFYEEAGVLHGIKGELFEMTPSDVAGITVDEEAVGGGLDKDEPLVALACAATWVMQALACNTADERWTLMLDKINSLMRLASYEAIGELLPDGTRRDTRSSTERQLTKILYVLIEVFETMRQSYPGGFCTAQLAFNYNKKIKKFLAKEWNERLSGLKDELGEQVMEMVQVKASLYGHLQPSGTESILLQHLVPAWNATPLSGMEPVGALAYKAFCYQQRLTRLRPDETTQLLVSRSPRRQVFLTLIAADGIKVADAAALPSGRTITMSLGEGATRPTEADDVQTECHPTTLVCDNPSSPSWKHEKIAFYVGNGKHLRRPLAVQIELHATDSPAAVGALLASGVVHLSECCSEATAALTPTDLLQAAPTVVFCAQVGPWLDE